MSNDHFFLGWNLADPQTPDRLFSYVDRRIMPEDNTGAALNLVANLGGYLAQHPDFAQEFPGIAQRYQDLLVRAKFVCLPSLRENEVVSLVSRHLIAMYDLPAAYDIIDKIKTFIISYGLINDRQRIKQRLAQGLFENGDHLTAGPLEKTGQPLEPTIANWLKDYLAAINDRYQDKVAVSQYLTDSPNVLHISNDERARVQRLIHLYNYLKVPADSPQGIDEKVTVDIGGELRTFEDGRFVDNRKLKEEVKKELAAVKPIFELTEIWKREMQTQGKIITTAADLARRKTKMAGNVSEKPVPANVPVPANQPADRPASEPIGGRQKPSLRPYLETTPFDTAVAAAEQALLPQIGRGTFNVRQTFDEAVAAKNAAKVVALFHVLAETRDVHKLMTADKTFRTKLAAKFGPDVAAHYDANPDAPVYLRVYLEYVLQDTLKLPQVDAARVAVRLANILGKRYLKIAFMDMTSGVFAWAPVVKDGKQLVLRY